MAYYTAAELTKMMMDYFKANGNDVWRNNNLAVKGRAFIGRKGVPDIIGYSRKQGTFIACEVKAIGDRLSPEQMVFLEQLGTVGGISLLCQQLRDETIRIKIYKNGESEDWEFIEGDIRKS